ncbi:MAG: alginate biosynthesis protein Alg44 [Geminicoccaceae bacterium]
MQPTVIQDAEIHRQHVRLRVPIVVEIDGVRHTVDDWSVNGFGVNAGLRGRQPGDRFPAVLVLPFEDFELRMQIECALVYALPDQSRFGCQFAGLSAGQLALFRFIVESYLAGEVVAGADLFAVIGREAAGEARVRQLRELAAQETGRGRRIQRALGFLLLALAGVGLGLLVAASVYERYFVVSTRRAVIEAPLYSLRASIAGTLEAGQNALVHPGEPVASLRPPTGAAVPLPSPCECVVDEWVVQPGGQVRPGEVVAVLVAADRPLVARAELPLAQARRLRVGQAAEIEVPGQAEPVSGQIESLSFKLPPPHNGTQRSLGDTEETMVPVVVRPDRPFDFDSQGFAVSVRFL